MIPETNKSWCEENIIGFKSKGSKGTGRCPLASHGGPDTHPSLSIDVDRGLYYCLKEKKGGTLAQLAQEIGCNPPAGAKNTEPVSRGRVVQTYEYRDANNILQYVKDRYDPKAFSIRRPDGKGGYINNGEGIVTLPYMLPELLAAQKDEAIIFVVEGEKDVGTLVELGYVATCNHGSAGGWGEQHSRHFKKDTEVVILPDNDEPGLKHAYDVASKLMFRGCRIKIPILPGLEDKGDVTDWFNAGGKKPEFEQLIISCGYMTREECDEAAARMEFEPDAAFPLDKPDRPPFPTDALPNELAVFVKAEAEAVQVPEDLVAMMVLPAVATAVAGKVEVVINEGYEEPVNIYSSTIQEPGTRKTRVVGDVTGPIVEYEHRLQEEARAVISQAKAQKSLLELKLEGVRTQLKKPDLTALRIQQLQADYERLQIDVDQFEIPAYPRLLADNCTTERLTTMIAEQNGCIASLSAEGMLFDIMLGRYSKTGTDIDVFLKGHAGDPLKVDRQKDRESGSPVNVYKPAITLGLAVQPRVLERIGREEDFKGKGLLGRFAWSYPRDLVGHRKVKTTPVPVSVVTGYRNLLFSLLSIKYPKDPENAKRSKPYQIRLSPQAEERWISFAEKVEMMQRPEGQLFYMRDWGSKLSGLVARIAGLLHMSEHAHEKAPWEQPIGQQTYENAIRIGEYLIPHALAVYGVFSEDPRRTTALQVVKWAERNGKIRVNRRELFDAFRNSSNLTNIPAFEQVLRFLESHGYVKQEKAANPGAKKPSLWVLFNPYVIKKDTVRTSASTHTEAPPQSAQSAQSYEPTETSIVDVSSLLEGNI